MTLTPEVTNRPMNTETVKLVRSHEQTYRNEHHDWLTRARESDGSEMRRRDSPRVRGSKWQAWECVNPDCDALALVLVAAIDTMVESWLPNPVPSEPPETRDAERD